MDKLVYRRPFEGAVSQWQIAEALLAATAELTQRFRPSRPERRLCRRFSIEHGCPFGDLCTHLHLAADGLTDVRDKVAQEIDATGKDHLQPLVYFHKFEDRKVGKGAISLILRTLATGGFNASPASSPDQADLLLTNAFPPDQLFLKLRIGCTVNHFPGEHELCNKDRLARLCRGLPVCPQTFIMPKELTELQGQASADPSLKWIVKPCQLGEGRHISILKASDVLDAESRLTDRCVVSEYISDPLLVEMHKIDLRVYVLVSRVEPQVEAFVFREGLVRLCGQEYDLSDGGLQQLAAHISNNSIQTKTARHASGKNWQLQDLWKWLDDGGGPASTITWKRVLRLVKHVLAAWCPHAKLAQRRIQGFERVRCYSLLAFDLLVDKNGRVWLLEVNPKPALHVQTASLKAVFPVHLAVKGPLLADLFSFIGLPTEHGGEARPVAEGDPLGFEPVGSLSAVEAVTLFGIARHWRTFTRLLQDLPDILSLARACPLWWQVFQCAVDHAHRTSTSA